MSARPRVAAIITIYRPLAHADVIATKFMKGGSTDEGLVAPEADLVSMYIDHVMEDDIGTALGAEYNVPIYPSIRQALHAGGDVMLGRRFTEPGGLLAGDAEVGALDVVSDLAPLFRAADVSVVNLETVLGDLALAGSYPGKRYVIGSPTRSVAALESLGVDVAVLANNHSRDWLDVGITSTRDVLRDRNIASVGARSTEDGVDDPVVLDVGGVQVGLLAYTTLNGDFVNQAYPGADDAPPIDLQDDARWQYEEREWSFDGPTVAIESDLRRIGPAWSLFEQMEDELADAERAFSEIKTYYNDITHNNLELIKNLKEDLENQKDDQAKNEKLMFEIAQENQKLSEPLVKALKDVDTLKMELQHYEKDKLSLMPADLQKQMSAQELVDVVAYMTTLKKAKK